MNKKLKYILLVLFLSFSSNTINAEVINNVIINGNKRVSDETIKIYGQINDYKQYSEKNANEILKSLFDTGFFEDINLSYENKNLTINIKEYPVISQLLIIGEKSKNFEKEIKKIISLKEKKSFIKSNLAKDVNTIKILYSSLGYNFAKVEAKINKINEETFDVLFEIDRGNKTKISKINFIGNDNVKSKRLEDIIASEESKFWKFISKNTVLSESLIELDKRLIFNYYKSIGFYDIKISSNLAEIISSEEANLTYTINEGERYSIGKISTNLDSVFDKKIFFPLNKTYSKLAGEYYSPFKVKKILDEIDEIISSNNLQFVEHNVEEEVKDKIINITFNIFEGEKELVERVNIKGNTVTNEDVIRSELILDEGDPFTKIKLDKSIANIKSRNIFKDVKYLVNKGSEDNLKVIDIEIEERPTGEISAGAGVGTSGGTVSFGIKENNWLGSGRSVEFQMDLDEESLTGVLSFKDPNYDKLGNSLNYYLRSEGNDKPDQGYENTILSAVIGTSFEQYKDLIT